jgi:hypothetical protein
MLLHQVIVLVASWSKRLDALLLHGIEMGRRVASRVKFSGSDLQET